MVARLQARVDAKWVRPEDFHVTLVFVGECADADLGSRVAAVRKVADRHRPMALEVTGWATFEARVLWARVEGEVDALAALAGDLGKALGVAPDHPRYTPHLTVARALRKAGDPMLEAVSAELKTSRFGGWVADRITVYESRAGRYVARAHLPLGDNH